MIAGNFKHLALVLMTCVLIMQLFSPGFIASNNIQEVWGDFTSAENGTYRGELEEEELVTGPTNNSMDYESWYLGADLYCDNWIEIEYQSFGDIFTFSVHLASGSVLEQRSGNGTIYLDNRADLDIYVHFTPGTDGNYSLLVTWGCWWSCPTALDFGYLEDGVRTHGHWSSWDVEHTHYHVWGHTWYIYVGQNVSQFSILIESFLLEFNLYGPSSGYPIESDSHWVGHNKQSFTYKNPKPGTYELFIDKISTDYYITVNMKYTNTSSTTASSSGFPSIVMLTITISSIGVIIAGIVLILHHRRLEI